MTPWKPFQLGPPGPAGVNGRMREDETTDTAYIYIDGSDHAVDWWHHFLPFARRRERAAAREILDIMPRRSRYVVGGHSVGGAIAADLAREIAAMGLAVKCYVFGPKRTSRDSVRHVTAAYRQRGDLVPYLPPWRKGYRLTTFGHWMPVIAAHEPREYFVVMARHDLF
jgi:hypothetical protein